MYNSPFIKAAVDLFPVFSRGEKNREPMRRGRRKAYLGLGFFLNTFLLAGLLSCVLVARAEVDSCIVGNYNLSKVPEANLLAREKESDGTSQGPYLWDILLCVNKEGFVKQYSKNRDRLGKVMNLQRIAVKDGYVQAVYAQLYRDWGYQMNLDIMCGTEMEMAWPSENYEVKSFYSEDSNIQFLNATVLTKAVCPVQPSGGSRACGGGCAFVVIFFVSLAVYVIVTVLWYYLRQGKRGKELLPHPEFWADFPYLLKDGVVYVYTKIRLCIGWGGSTTQYEQM
ncbi:hypothetical protein MOQ_002709 [Trypanosoma cruzi marinkellei]|uniref:Cation-dependent mannose-6-phosphate receptor n=1 Tax=Trypanosoma cruzi marinkellei TaxID=85056 RepID=K2N618_TRYCR|nr:hypothetical protein MOQ_002709 [Trypanosoma cruzi marinkellei]